MTLITLNEVNVHYSKHGLKQIFVADEKKMETLNNQLIDQFENLKEVNGEDSPDLIETKKELEFLLKHNCKTPSCLDVLIK